ncbi:MAG: hypothetical protein IJJ23_12370 [Clostridia bacterium]|nr:hypothetical protein [Clostridia bacterium]
MLKTFSYPETVETDAANGNQIVFRGAAPVLSVTESFFMVDVINGVSMTPVARERSALEDIASSNIDVYFVPYKIRE